MTITSIITPGAPAPSENNPDVESAAGTLDENFDFANLLASSVTTVPQTVMNAESAADVAVDLAESVPKDDQVSQDADESGLAPSAILAFMAPVAPTITAPEPVTALASETGVIAGAPFTEAANIDGDQTISGDGTDHEPTHAARFTAPFEPPLAAALVQDVDGDSDRLTFANETSGQPQDRNGSVLDAKAPLREVAAAVDTAAPIGSETLKHLEFGRSAELPPRIDESALGRAVPRELRSSGSERAVNPSEIEPIDSASLSLENPAIEKQPRQDRLTPGSRSSFANHREDSTADHAQFKPGEIPVDPQDSPPQRLVPTTADAAAAPKLTQENGVVENTGKPVWQPLVQRVGEHIVRQLQIGEQQAVIELEPLELGRIKIDLRVVGEQIHARIVAEEPGTKALIESHLGELRQALEIRQVDLASLRVEPPNVSNGGAQWAQSFNDGARQGQGRWQDDSGLADRSTNDAPQRESSPGPASDPGRISMWA